MVSLAFCDDDPQVLASLAALTDRYRRERDVEMEYTSYQSPLELLSAMEQGARYSVLVLDVLMPGESGIDAAREIRALDRAVKIIFLTSSEEHAVQSYSVGAYYYQLKPVEAERLFPLLDAVVEELRRQERDSLVLTCKSGVIQVELAELMYCEVFGRELVIHLSDGTALHSSGKLGELARRLEARGGFLHPHRSYLVNMDYIREITRRTVLLKNMQSIPIPRGKYTELKDAFLEHAFRKRRVVL